MIVEEDEPGSPVCEFCQSEVDRVTTFTMPVAKGTKSGDLCDVCATSFAGNALFYPTNDTHLLQVMSQQTNIVLDAIKKLGAERAG